MPAACNVKMTLHCKIVHGKIYAKAKVSMKQYGHACLHAVDGCVSCERTRETEKPQVFLTFAGAFLNRIH